MSDERGLSGVLRVFQIPSPPTAASTKQPRRTSWTGCLIRVWPGSPPAWFRRSCVVTTQSDANPPRSSSAQRARHALSVIRCGAESTRVAVGHEGHAQETGADTTMAISPISVVLADDELYSYYAAIADSTSIGLVVQGASGYAGRPLSVALQVRLLTTYGERVFIKPEAPPIGQRVSELRDASDGAARIFKGTAGAALADSFRGGVVGSVPGAEVLGGPGTVGGVGHRQSVSGQRDQRTTPSARRPATLSRRPRVR